METAKRTYTEPKPKKRWKKIVFILGMILIANRRRFSDFCKRLHESQLT